MKVTYIAAGMALLLSTIGAATVSAQAFPDIPDQDTSVVEEAAWVPSDSTVMAKVWFLFINEPQRQMKSTLVHLSKNEQDKAAATVLTTAAYLRLETLRAHGKELAELHRSIKELDKLAEEISVGKITKPEEVGKPFNDALLALARFHYGQAQRALARDDAKESGKELKATAAVLDYGFISNEGGLDADAINDLTYTRSVADSLMTGERRSSDRSHERLLARLKADIGRLAKLSREV
jgi:hypothetical protein